MVTSAQSRRSRILEFLQLRGATSVEELSTRFGVSGMTIRRDLTALEQVNQVHRVRGGAIPVSYHFDGGSRSSPQPATQDQNPPLLPNRPDVMILNPMDQRMARMIVQEASQRNIPIIAESIPFNGITTLVAIDSYRAGMSLGQWVGRYVHEQMAGIARVLFVGLPSFSDTAERARGFFEGLRALISQPAFTMTINGRGLRQSSHQVTAAALSTHPDINVIIGVNDQAALGAVDAMHQLRLPVNKVLVGTFGLEGSAGKQILMKECPRSVGVAMFPEFIGRVCADVAVKAYNDLPLPAQVVTPTAIVTSETLQRYYRFAEGRWEIQWEVVQDIPGQDWSSEAALLAPDSVTRFPRQIDFVRYLHDEYYDQLVKGLQQRATEFGIMVRATDASVDLAATIDLVRRAIGKIAARLISADEAVILDAGTTNTYLAQELAQRRDQKFTVITNSVQVIEALKVAEHITLVGIGGILHRPSQSFLGAQAEATFDELRADKAFIGVAGINIDYGISNTYLAQADFKRCILKAAKEVIVVADSFKIGEISHAKLAPISAIHKLVTDDLISSQDRLAFTQAGIEVILATNH